MSNSTFIEWLEVCGNASLFWDSELTLNTTSPDLTPCFQATILVWVPCGLLWLCAIFYLPYLCRKPTVNGWGQKSAINWVKLVDIVLLLGVSLADLIRTILDGSDTDVPLYMYLDPAIRAATFLLSTVLIHLEYSKGLHTSGPFFPFWVLLVILGIVPFRSKIMAVNQDEGHVEDLFRFITFYVYYGLILVQFCLLFVADLQALEYRDREVVVPEEEQPLLGNVPTVIDSEEAGRQRPPCPEARTTFLGVITHWWITKLIIRGYRRTLVFEDLFDLLDRDKCKTVEPEFRKDWNRRVENYRKKHPLVEVERQSPPSNPSSTPTGPPSTDRDTPTDGSTEEDGEGEGGVQKGKQEEKKPALRKGPSLMMTLFKTSGSHLIIGACCRLFIALWQFLNPILLQEVITFVSGSSSLTWKGYVLAVALLLVNMIQALASHLYFKHSFIMAMRTRSAVITAVYRKAVRLSNVSRKTTTVGEIVNLMSVDAQKLHDVCSNIHELWVSPISIVIAIYLLWQVIGPSCLTGLAILLIVAPINGGALARLFIKFQVQQMQLKDTRIKLINEILAGVKVLKMYAWEPSFSDTIKDVRKNEMSFVRRQSFILCAIDVVIMCAPYMVTLAVFATFVLSSSDNYLSPQIAFVSLNLIQILNFGLSFVPIFIAFAAQASVSVGRITNMLMQDEIDPNAVNYDWSDPDSALCIDDGTFSWGGPEDGAVLKNINMSIKHKNLVAVVGQVGCGKSSLISAILGELKKLSGTVNVQGKVAYVPQQAWIQNATLRDNILFGKPFNQEYYDKVLDACALKPDLKILQAGDMTEIGEKGINLSGGQKQRVSLARAVYQNCDIYLLDDPLSAVDAHVGKHIFENLVGNGGILERKTRVLVTHGISYLPKVDEILVMKDGVISERGTFDSLLKENGAFADFLRAHLAVQEGDSGDEEDEEEGEERKDKVELDPETTKTLKLIERQLSSIADSKGSGDSTSGKKLRRRLSSRRSRTISVRSDGESKKKQKPDAVKDVLIAEETAETGKVQWSVLRKYISSAGFRMLLQIVGFLLVLTGSQVGTNIWLSKWSDDPVYDDPADARDQIDLRLGVYGAFGLFQVVGTMGLSLTVMLGGVLAARVMHGRLLDRILHAPMSFFDTTPLGRIVNRFSTDMDKLDFNIPIYTRFWFFQMTVMLSTLTLISYSTPIFLVVVVPIGIIYFIIQRVYITTLRQLKRIDSIRRSPIYINFDETLVGVNCVRAFGQQKRFIAKNDRLVDENQMAWYPVLISQRWIGFFLDTLGAFIVFFACLFAVQSKGTITGGLVGLSVSFAMQATMSINMIIRGSAELETHVVSIERIQEYSEVESEAPWRVESEAPDRTWPADGVVKFENYSTRYREGLDLVLKDMSFDINSGEKVGIVGRTGAGKSSMALSLFRIIEAAGGQITIDGVNISNIGLHDLRGRLTIIPQDPVVFSGTLRNNLDPFCKYSDPEVWEALQHAHLKAFVTELPNKLEYQCGEGGESLSVGQRQLVCLARALLRKSKILVLDEATAAVDMETDDLIQNTIRTEFKGCTVLTVAHRLNTILDYDRVMVLDHGEIKEFDAPQKLLEKQDSIFCSMARDAGIARDT